MDRPAARAEPALPDASGELYRHDVQGPDGKPVTIYYRESQRRERAETDGEFCLEPGGDGRRHPPPHQATAGHG